MHRVLVEEELRAALDAVHAYNPVVADFTVEHVLVEPEPDPFVPALAELQGTLKLSVPVVYTYRSFVTGPPDNSRLDELRAAIEACLRARPPLRRARIERWETTPDAYPAPEAGAPAGHLHWTVAATVSTGRRAAVPS